MLATGLALNIAAIVIAIWLALKIVAWERAGLIATIGMIALVAVDIDAVYVIVALVAGIVAAVGIEHRRLDHRRGPAVECLDDAYAAPERLEPTDLYIKEHLMSCEHLASLDAVEPSDSDGCHDCLRTGDDWLHLRMCMDCGYVGCCDSSPNIHATQHHRMTGHPVIQGFEPGKRWAFCYPHQKMLSDVGDTLARSYQ